MFKRDSTVSKPKVNNLNLVSRINLKAWPAKRLLLNHKSIIILLVTLDLLFIAIYIGHFLVDNIFPNYTGFLLTSTKLSIQKDGTYPEIFQYFKEFIIAAVLLLVFTRKRHIIYLAWSLLFGFLLLDDSLQFHERLGTLTALYFDFSPMLGLRAQDFGELSASAAPGIFLFSFLALGYYLTDSTHRKISQHLLFLLAVLLFFGVAADMIHILLGGQTRALSRTMVLIEDGGEMFAMSVIAWYALRLFYRNYFNDSTKPEPTPTPGPKLVNSTSQDDLG